MTASENPLQAETQVVQDGFCYIRKIKNKKCTIPAWLKGNLLPAWLKFAWTRGAFSLLFWQHDPAAGCFKHYSKQCLGTTWSDSLCVCRHSLQVWMNSKLWFMLNQKPLINFDHSGGWERKTRNENTQHLYSIQCLKCFSTAQITTYSFSHNATAVPQFDVVSEPFQSAKQTSEYAILSFRKDLCHFRYSLFLTQRPYVLFHEIFQYFHLEKSFTN